MKRLKIFQGKNIIHCGINLTQLPFEKSRLKPQSLLHCAVMYLLQSSHRSLTTTTKNEMGDTIGRKTNKVPHQIQTDR